MLIFDSVKKQKVEFVPITPNAVRIYVCGPTVYDNAHLGHARSSIVFDLLRRILEANGYEVIFVKNFTDIDDKIVQKSKESGKSIDEITALYTQNYLNEMESLNIQKPHFEPRATQNLNAIFEMIKILLSRNLAYTAPNGDIYMRTNADNAYGSLSNRAHLEAQISRIGENEYKEDVRDFALWKVFTNPSDVGYESPFGRGRPGWHIECSAMIEEHLAYKNGAFSIDIHGGGMDLLFPHHENEASQSRCANGRELAKYWMHNAFVNVNGEKMSKSLGNSFFIKDALKAYGGEILRYYLLSIHYRSPLNFSHSDIMQAKKRLDRLYRLKKRLSGARAEAKDAEAKFARNLLDALNDDINVSIALSVVDAMLSHYNDLLDKEPKNAKTAQIALANIALVDELLGIGGKDAISYFQSGVSEEKKAWINEKILARSEARARKDYALSDKIRDELKAQHIQLLDTREGVIWEYIGE